MPELTAIVNQTELDSEWERDRRLGSISYGHLQRILNDKTTVAFVASKNFAGNKDVTVARLNLEGEYLLEVYPKEPKVEINPEKPEKGDLAIEVCIQPDERNGLSVYRAQFIYLSNAILLDSYVGEKLKQKGINKKILGLDNIKYADFPEIYKCAATLPESEQFPLYIALSNVLDHHHRTPRDKKLKIWWKLSTTRSKFDFTQLGEYAPDGYRPVNSLKLEGNTLTINYQSPTSH